MTRWPLVSRKKKTTSRPVAMAMMVSRSFSWESQEDTSYGGVKLGQRLVMLMFFFVLKKKQCIHTQCMYIYIYICIYLYMFHECLFIHIYIYIILRNFCVHLYNYYRSKTWTHFDVGICIFHRCQHYKLLFNNHLIIIQFNHLWSFECQSKTMWHPYAGPPWRPKPQKPSKKSFWSDQNRQFALGKAEICTNF